tara:strand:- start:766 stop:1200 length:435 start_codon:yes stop_codon:yes gene_type:complete
MPKLFQFFTIQSLVLWIICLLPGVPFWLLKASVIQVCMCSIMGFALLRINTPQWEIFMGHNHVLFNDIFYHIIPLILAPLSLQYYSSKNQNENKSLQTIGVTIFHGLFYLNIFSPSQAYAPAKLTNYQIITTACLVYGIIFAYL